VPTLSIHMDGYGWRVRGARDLASLSSGFVDP
jgi:hypothetical protein